MQTFLFGKRIERRVKYRRYQFILYIKYIDFPIFTDNEDTSIDINSMVLHVLTITTKFIKEEEEKQ